MADPKDEDKKNPDSVTDAQGRVWIKRRTAMTKEEAIEWMVECAVEEEMKRCHPDTYRDPDDRVGTA